MENEVYSINATNVVIGVVIFFAFYVSIMYAVMLVLKKMGKKDDNDPVFNNIKNYLDYERASRNR